MSILGGGLSQHQQAFLTEKTGEVARVARRVLSILAAGDADALKVSAVIGTPATARSLSDVADRLYSASICPDPLSFADAIKDVARAGFSNDILAFELIPAIACRLGAAWEDDLITFANVTIGCARLQSTLRRLPDAVEGGAVAHNGMRQNCLVIVPLGAQHTMGALVLAKQLRHARQRVVIELEADAGKLCSMAQTHAFNMVLISASRGECPVALGQLVGVVRDNWPTCKVVVGGSINDLESDSVGTIGADHVTKDWREALDLCI